MLLLLALGNGEEPSPPKEPPLPPVEAGMKTAAPEQSEPKAARTGDTLPAPPPIEIGPGHGPEPSE